MRKSLLPALLALSFGLLFGCSEDENLKPYFTRIHASSNCGVAPLQVDFQAFVSGGNRTADPTGANDFIDIAWDFGDGATANGSVVYHSYPQPGTYLVTLIGTDDDGDVTDPRGELTIEVRADTMEIFTAAFQEEQPVSSSLVCDIVKFSVSAEACNFVLAEGDFDPSVSYLWSITGGDTVYEYTNREPEHAFALEDIGPQEVRVVLKDLGRGLTRQDAFGFEVLGASSELTLAGTVDNDTPASGEVVNFTLTVTNNGPAEAMGIVVTHQLPFGLFWASDEVSQGEYDRFDKIWTVGDLPVSGNATLDLGAQVGVNDVVLELPAWISNLSCRLDNNADNDTTRVQVTVDP